MTRTNLIASFVLPLGLALAACSSSSPEEQAKAQVTQSIKTELDNLVQAMTDLQAAAPAPKATGWVLPDDQAAIDSMKDAWKRSRTSYERIEGAIAVLFTDIDDTFDNRYTAFLDENGPDNDLFDDQDVTGNHAIERILWSQEIPAAVIQFESEHDGYVAARYPMNAQEATEFKTKLCQRAIADVTTMQTQFATAVVLDDAAAFRGVIGSMGEQVEKVKLSATSEEESRYAQHTLGDMRANLEGAQLTLDGFKVWITAENGTDLVDQIQARLDAIKAAYGAIPGDAIPPVPMGFDPNLPSCADLMTPYGQLFQLLSTESDPDHDGSAVQLMDKAADLMKIPQLPR